MGKTFAEVISDEETNSLSEKVARNNLKQLQDNIKSAKIARIFNDINCEQLLYLKVLAEQLPAALHKNNTMDNWVDQAIKMAYQDLFDQSGEIKSAIKKVLLEAGIGKERIQQKDFKKELLSDYFTNIIAATGFDVIGLIEETFPDPKDQNNKLPALAVLAQAQDRCMYPCIEKALQYFPSLPNTLLTIQEFAQNHLRSTGCKQIIKLIDKMLQGRDINELSPAKAQTLFENIQKIAEKRLDKFFITSMTRESSTHQFFKALTNPELTSGSLNLLTDTIQDLSNNYNKASRLSEWLKSESKKEEKHQAPKLRDQANTVANTEFIEHNDNKTSISNLSEASQNSFRR